MGLNSIFRPFGEDDEVGYSVELVEVSIRSCMQVDEELPLILQEVDDRMQDEIPKLQCGGRPLRYFFLMVFDKVSSELCQSTENPRHKKYINVSSDTEPQTDRGVLLYSEHTSCMICIHELQQPYKIGA